MENQQNKLGMNGIAAEGSSSKTSSLSPSEREEAQRLIDASFGGPILSKDERAEQEAAAKARAFLDRLASCGVPSRHLQRELDYSANLKWTEVNSKIRGKLGAGFLIALVGSRGRGKTQLAVSACRNAAEAGGSILFVDALDIFMAIKDGFKSTDRERAIMDRFVKPSLLVVDEATERGETPWEDRMFGYILNKRYAAQRDTLIIGNFDEGGLLKSLGASVIDRLNETGGIIECNWKSFRE